MKKTRFLFLLIVAFTCVITWEIKAETIYLKNGSVINGTIIEEIPYSQYKIETGDGSIIICNYEEIEKITRDSANKKNLNEKSNRSVNSPTVKYKGYVGNTFGFGRFFVDNLFINNGISINENVFLGIGLGLFQAVDYNNTDYLISGPIYFIGRYDFHKFTSNKWAPFVEIDLGYNIKYAQYIKADIGYHYKFNGHYGFGTSLGVVNVGRFVGASLTFAFDW